MRALFEIGTKRKTHVKNNCNFIFIQMDTTRAISYPHPVPTKVKNVISYKLFTFYRFYFMIQAFIVLHIDWWLVRNQQHLFKISIRAIPCLYSHLKDNIKDTYFSITMRRFSICKAISFSGDFIKISSILATLPSKDYLKLKRAFFLFSYKMM